MKRPLARESIRNAALVLVLITAAWAQPWRLLAQGPASLAPQPATGIKYSKISPDDMKEWLSYLASDQLQGRKIFTEGFGLAAQYVADHLKEWGVKPLAADGTYYQPVKLKGYRVTRTSTVTVEVNGQSKTFKHGDHVTFPVNGGGKQTLTFNGVEFAGYGQQTDFQGRDLKDKLVVTISNLTPAPAANAAGGRGRGAAAPVAPTTPAAATAAATPALPGAVAQPAPARGGARGGGAAGATALGAKAFIGFTAPAAAQTPAEQALVQAQTALTQANAAVAQAQQALRGGGRGAPAQPAAGARGGQAAPADLTTVQRVDGIVTPQFNGDQTFYEALFEGASVKFADILASAQRGEPIAPVTLPAKVTINIDNTFDVINEQISHNVVGLIEGTDPVLKNTYVMFGAHLDHIGYSQTGAGRGGGTDACRRRSPDAQAAVTAAGKVVQRPAAAGAGGQAAGGRGGQGGAAAPAVPLDQRDLVNNGADDDGSGSTAELAIAKAFATGPKPKRSLVFIWHTGEEAGLYGSRYNADFPIVPLDKVQAQLNMDMVGRDDCNDLEGDYSNSLFIIGDDRISTDLHNLIVGTNKTSSTPMILDYEMNDPNDPESVYTRSDHFSYAAKGIPIAFFTTGLHPDYHRVTDTVDKILFPKMARIAQLVYESGFSLANTDRVLERDNKGPRTGFGSKAEIIPK
ncbi:MAG TPA: M28 family peptidase [Terriglobia bacterium]|nr:M28 family peptidase [Terriglobia bacterium]